MRLVYKILLAVVLVLGLAVVGLFLLVRAYLRPEKIRPLVIDEVQKAFHRKVELSRVEVGLFKGIHLEGLAVKEADGRTDFVRVKDLKVKFALWPLLHRRVVLTQAEISGPYVHLVRDRQGRFNWQTLVPPSKPRKGVAPSPKAGLPFLLVVPRFEVKGGLLVFEDLKGELPSLRIPFELSASLAETEARGRLSFRLFDSPWQAQARVVDWASKPVLYFVLSGKTLNLNPFLKDKTRTSRRTFPSRGGGPVRPPLLPFRQAEVQIAIKRVLYRELVVSDLGLKASYAKGRLVSDLQCKVAGGTVKSHLQADLGIPSWEIRESARDLELAELLDGLCPDLPGRFRGRASLEGQFSASGWTSARIRDTLAGSGTFQIHPLELSHLPATQKLAALLGLPELSVLVFEKGSGKFQIAHQRAVLLADLAGRNLSAHIPRGVLTLDGRLDFPVDLVFSSETSKKLTERWPLARHLTNRRGQVELTVRLLGPYRRPRVIVRSRPLERKIEKELEERFEQWLK